MSQSGRDLACIGYVALAVKVCTEEGANDVNTAKDLSAAVAWLRRRADVLPRRIGVVAWGTGAEQALLLAANSSLQGCVLCGGSVVADHTIITRLKSTAILCIVGGNK